MKLKKWVILVLPIGGMLLLSVLGWGWGDDDEEETALVPVTPGIPNIPYEDEDTPDHNEYGFCTDMDHECHEDQENIYDLNQDVEDGLATPDDAYRLYRAETI